MQPSPLPHTTHMHLISYNTVCTLYCTVANSWMNIYIYNILYAYVLCVCVCVCVALPRNKKIETAYPRPTLCPTYTTQHTQRGYVCVRHDALQNTAGFRPTEKNCKKQKCMKIGTLAQHLCSAFPVFRQRQVYKNQQLQKLRKNIKPVQKTLAQDGRR